MRMRDSAQYGDTRAAQCGDSVAPCDDGCALWATARHRRNRHLGEMRLSVLEKVLLLDLDAVLNQKSPVLIGKGHTMMVLFLLGDITHYHVFVTQTV